MHALYTESTARDDAHLNEDALANKTFESRLGVLPSPWLQEFFPPEKIHSGESDFDPPRFKPDPSVYLLAAEKTDARPENCIAVEDSTSGVGSAANAGLGMIVGYVGGSHISAEMEDGHAGTLMAGGRSENGRGADIVIRDMKDLVGGGTHGVIHYQCHRARVHRLIRLDS